MAGCAAIGNESVGCLRSSVTRRPAQQQHSPPQKSARRSLYLGSARAARAPRCCFSARAFLVALQFRSILPESRENFSIARFIRCRHSIEPGHTNRIFSLFSRSLRGRLIEFKSSRFSGGSVFICRTSPTSGRNSGEKIERTEKIL